MRVGNFLSTEEFTPAQVLAPPRANTGPHQEGFCRLCASEVFPRLR